MLENWEKIIDPNFISSEVVGSVGTEIIRTITDIDFMGVRDSKTNKTENKVCLAFEEGKPMVLNATNKKSLKKIFKGLEPKDCVGKKIVIYVTTCSAFGKQLECLRIKEYSEIKCEKCGATITPYASKSVNDLVEMSKKNCNGQTLCIECMKKYKQEMEDK